jgi:hypothetical protein
MSFEKKRQERIVFTAIFIIGVLFYLFWYWKDGIIITEDAESYIYMQSDREPGYCSFLWILRRIFGDSGSLVAAVVIQCVIAAIAADYLAINLRRILKLNWLCTACILFIQYGVTLLNRFVAQRRYSYYNSIETEGLTYSFWVFFIIGLIVFMYEKNIKGIISAIVWSVLLISIRKQMLITLGLLFFCLFFTLLKGKKLKKALLKSVIVVFAVFISTKLIDCTYNYAIRGVFEPHTGDANFILGTQVYLANEDMASYISDDTNRDIFLEIINRADMQQYNIRYAGKGWHEVEDHYSNSYDRIKFDIINAVIGEYQDKLGIAKSDRDVMYNELSSTLMKELMIPCMSGIIKIFACNVIHGLITTILKVNPVLNVLALFIYIVYFAMLIWLVKNKTYVNNPSSPIALCITVLLAMLLNILLTSITIYCQMRYMLYNTALFYQSLLAMLIEVKRLRK